MTQEEKSLLLKDLCSRLNDGVKVHCEWNMFQGGRCSEDGELVAINIHAKSIHFERNSGRITEIPFNRIDGTVLPYLRPMSSMTEEDKKDILQSLNIHGDIDNEGNLLLGVECNIITLKVCKKYLEELNKRMFDVCNMIEKGLALEAHKDMYKID